MGEIEIKVKHKVSPDLSMCVYGGDFWGKDVCMYHTHRDRTHGRKAPKERNLPKCTLFNKWLDGEYKKCKECKDECFYAMNGEKLERRLSFNKKVRVFENPYEYILHNVKKNKEGEKTGG